MNKSPSQPVPSAFDAFYNAPSPLGALNLAISDAIHGKQSEEFYRELVRARDILEAHEPVVAALRRALPFVEAKASVNEITGWASDASGVVELAKNALRGLPR